MLKKNNYIKLLDPSHPYSKKGYIWEHRVVVERFIGRILEPFEIIHHIDEDKTNNKIENLMVFQSNKEHIKWHTKLRQYGYTTSIMKRIIENRWKELEELDRKLNRPKGLNT